MTGFRDCLYAHGSDQFTSSRSRPSLRTCIPVSMSSELFCGIMRLNGEGVGVEKALEQGGGVGDLIAMG